MNLRHLLSGITAITMATALFSGTVLPTQLSESPLIAFAEETTNSGTCGENLTWVLDDNGILTISGTGEMDWRYGWGNNKDEIKEIIIEDGATSVYYYAFKNCPNLTSVILPNSMTEIGTFAFEGCTSLTSITIPDSVSRIGACAFEECTSLTSIIIPDGVTTIESSTFSGCKNLVSVTIPDSVTNIESYAFYQTAWLKAQQEENPLVIVNHILIDGKNCTGDVIIPDDVISIGDGAFLLCSYLTSVTISDSVTNIGEKAFEFCSKLTSVTIPESVINIGKDAFYYTPWLETKQKENPVVIVNHILIDGSTCTGNITIPSDVICVNHRAFYSCKDLSSVIIPDNVESIGEYAFYGCTNLTSVTIKNPNCKLEGSDNSFNNRFPETVTIYGYPNSTAQAYAEQHNLTFVALDEEIPATSHTFTWGKDNWNFNNSDNEEEGEGYFPVDTTYGEQIDDAYLEKLKENLSNTEYQAVFEGYLSADKNEFLAKDWNGNFWYQAEAYNYWNGSCQGMSATALLSKAGLLPYSEYKSGASSLHDLEAPVENWNISSLITYYQLLQFKEIDWQQHHHTFLCSHETNIKKILSELDKYDTVLVGFDKANWGGHAVLAYDYSYGNWIWSGERYDGCIYIYDPNYSTEYNEECNIYFNSKYYDWVIPAYNEENEEVIASESGTKFNYISGDVNIINAGGYFDKYSSSTEIEDFIINIYPRYKFEKGQ